jgi:hypothetical protein
MDRMKSLRALIRCRPTHLQLFATTHSVMHERVGMSEFTEVHVPERSENGNDHMS